MALIELDKTSGKYRTGNTEISVTKSIYTTTPSNKYDKYEHRLTRPLSSGFFHLQLRQRKIKVFKSSGVFKKNIILFEVFYKMNNIDNPIVIGLSSSNEYKYFNFKNFKIESGTPITLSRIPVIVKKDLNSKLDQLSVDSSHVIKGPEHQIEMTGKSHSGHTTTFREETNQQFIIIDMDRKNGSSYSSGVEGVTIRVMETFMPGCENFRRYQHSISGSKSGYTTKFTSSINNVTITNDKHKEENIFEVILYYSKINLNYPIFMEINGSHYYKDLIKTDKNSYNLSEVGQTGHTECKSMNAFIKNIPVLMNLDIHEHRQCENVQVNVSETVEGSDSYKKCTHTASQNFKGIEIKCISSNCCNIIGFNGSEYTNDNLKEINVYFSKNDVSHDIPLLIEIVKNGPDEGNKQYFELKSIKKNDESSSIKWSKAYIVTRLDGAAKLSNKLEEIDSTVVEREQKSGESTTSPQTRDSDNIGFIAGGVAVGLVVVAALGGLVIYKKCCSVKAPL